MHDAMLAIGPLERPNWRHQRAACVRPIARSSGIHVPRVKADGTVVSLASTAGHRTNKAFTVTTLEALFRRMSSMATCITRDRLLRWQPQRLATPCTLLPSEATHRHL